MILHLAKKAAAFGLLTIALVCASSTNAFATHFRYGTITYSFPNPSQPNVVTFTVQLAFRRDFFNPLPSPFPPNNVVNVAENLNIYNETAGGTLVTTFTINALQVQSMNAAEDWFIGTQSFTYTFPVTGTPVVYKADYLNCCRVSTLLDSNHDINFDIWALVTVVAPGQTPDHPPIGSTLPILSFAQNHAVSYQIPAVDQDGDPISFRLATSAESGLNNAKPLEPAPPGPGAFNLTSTGLVTWTPTTVGLYGIQIVLTDTHGASSVLDFILQVLPGTGTAPTLTINGSATNLSMTIPPGQPLTLALNATDPDLVGGGPTPLLLTSNVLPATAAVLPSLPVTLPSPASATMTWTPGLGDLGPHLFQFSATDDQGLQSIVSVSVTVDQSVGMYVAGVLRDFPTGTTDFGVANGDNSASLVLPALGSGGKPSFNTAAGATTIASGTSFANWWSGGTASEFTAVLSNAGSSNPHVYTLNTSNFAAGHTFFTYEAHSYYTYSPGDVLTFGSSDDMWVFLNGILVADMGGVHATPRTAVVTVDTLASSLGLSAGGTYPIAIFYAHRSGAHGAAVQLSATPPVVCDPIPAPTAVALSTLTRVGGATRPADGFIHLAATTASAAWTPAPILISDGFSTTFSFKTNPSTGTGDGVAFVIQSAAGNALGTTPLGYQGIAHSIAVEFDAHQDVADLDPAYDQVSVHTQFASPNSALETSSISVSSNTDGSTGAPFHFDDGALHQVRVQLVPANPADPAGLLYLRAFVDGNSAPAVNATITQASFTSAFPAGTAYLGFTSGNPAVTAEVQVQSFALATPSVSAGHISVITPPMSIDPGNTGTMTVQLRDACNGAMSGGGTASSFAASLASDTYTTPVTTTDNLDGTFTFSYTPIVGGDWILGVTYGGQSILGNPFHVQVSPATPTVTVTDATFTYDSHAHASTGSATGVLNEDLGPISFTYNGDPAAPINANAYAVVGTFTADAAGHYKTASANGSLAITQATPAINFAGGPFTYDATAHSATATVTGVLGETVASATVFYNGSTTPPTDAATYSLSASFSASGNYGDATGTGSMTIGQATPMVTVGGGPFTYDATAHAATGSVSGVNGVDLGALASITYNGDQTAPTDAGTYALVGTYAGSPNYKTATGSGTMLINRATPAVAVAGGPFTYDATPHAATANVTGVNNVALSGATITYDGNSTPPTNAGTYALKATFAQTQNYESASATGSMTINRATPIVIVTGGTFVFNGSAYAATGTVTGVNNTSLGTPSFTYDDQPTAPANAGTYHVVGSYAGDTNYEPAQGTATLEIDKATPALTWTTPAAIVYGTALSGAQLNASASVTGAFAYTPGAGTVPAAGTVKLTADFTPDDTANYNTASTFVMLPVTAAPLTIAANDATKTYGGPAPSYTVNYNGFVNGDSPASLAGTLTFGGPAATAVTVGSYDIVPAGLSSTNYSVTFQKGTLHISAAPLVIAANNLTKLLGQAVTFAGTEFTASGLVPGDTVSSVTLTSAGAPASAPFAGSPYDIVPSNAVGTGLGNYTIAYVNGKLTVVPTPPTIASVTPSLAALWPANHRMVPVTVAVVATSPVDPSPVCTITGVTSNEPVDPDGDWVVAPNSLALSLRADRLGTGTGRIYTISVRCTDMFGDASTATTVVSVPHDQGK